MTVNPADAVVWLLTAATFIQIIECGLFASTLLRDRRGSTRDADREPPSRSGAFALRPSGAR